MPIFPCMLFYVMLIATIYLWLFTFATVFITRLWIWIIIAKLHRIIQHSIQNKDYE